MADKNASTQEAITVEEAIAVNDKTEIQETAQVSAEKTQVSARTARPSASPNLRLVYSGEPTIKQVDTHAMSSPREVSSRPAGPIDRFLLAQLGRQLRAIYHDVASEPVPDRFVKLLERLAAKEDGFPPVIGSFQRGETSKIESEPDQPNPEKDTKS